MSETGKKSNLSVSEIAGFDQKINRCGDGCEDSDVDEFFDKLDEFKEYLHFE